MTSYEHSQVAGLVFWLPLSLSLVASGYTALATDHLAAILLFTGLATLVLLFYRLKVTIDDSSIRLVYGIGLVRFQFQLAEITGCCTVKNRWWYGFGIRLTPHGWLYNIAGLGAVELVRQDGRKTRIGTDEPEALCRAIQINAGLTSGKSQTA